MLPAEDHFSTTRRGVTLQGAETIQKYLDDEGTDDELRTYFQQVQQGYRRASDMGKQLLVQRIDHEH
jgi:hypothetical protein